MMEFDGTLKNWFMLRRLPAHAQIGDGYAGNIGGASFKLDGSSPSCIIMMEMVLCTCRGSSQRGYDST
jgi:hypothetical protein